MAVTTKKFFPATSNATTTVFSTVGIQLNNQDDLDVYITESGGSRVLQLRQATSSTATSSHPQVNNTDGLYFPAVSAGTNLINYQLSNDNNTITFNSALPQGAVVFCERRTRDADSTYTTFASGSTIRATDLNSSATESNFTAQDARNKALEMEGAIFNGAQISPIYVTSANIVDGTIQTADIGADQITTALIADDQIDSEHYVAGSIDLEHMSANSVDSDQYVDGSIDLIHMSANSVDSDQYVDGSIDRIHLEADIIDSTKLADNAVNSEHYVDGSIDHEHLANDIIDGENIQDDVINSEHYVAGSIDHEHLANDIIDGDNIQDSVINSEHYVNGSIDRVHLEADIIDSTKLADDAVGTEHIQNGAVKVDQIDNAEITVAKLNPSAVITAAEQATATANDTSLFTSAAAEAAFLRQDSSETIASGVTWSASDAFVATTAAIDLRVIELVDNVGGFVPIANETSFPTENPDINTSGSAKGGTIVSVQAASTNLAPTGTTVTIANGRGSGLPVVITGVTTTIPSGFGFLVETTATDHTYAFHRLVPVATQVATVANNITPIVQAGNNVVDINNFADLYQISTSAPTTRFDSSALQVGDLWFDSSSNKVLMIYDGSAGDGFSAATPNQAALTNINIVAGHLVFTEDLGLITEAVATGTGNASINTVANNISSVNTIANATNLANITAVAADATDIGTVAGKATEIGRLGTADAVSDMNTLATTAIVNDMDTLADISSNITTVAGISSNVTAVAGNASNINAVNSNSSNINAVNSNSSNINAAVSNASNINTVAGISSNVTTVAGISGNVTAVANDAADIGAVAGKATEIGRLGTAAAVADLAILGTTDVVADLNTLATNAIVSDMDTLADISSNITTVAGISSNVTTVAGNNSNVTAVAGNNSNITAVANNASNINAAVGNASNINAAVNNASNINTVSGISGNVTTVAGVSSNVTTVAGSISNVNTAATNIASINTTAASIANVNNFTDKYQVSSSNPSTDGGGNTLAAGDLYFNTTQNELRVYTGSTWQGGVTATGALLLKSGGQMTGNITMAGTQTVDGRDLSVDGTKLDGITANAIANLVQDTSPQLGGALDGQNNNLNNIATIDGTNLTLDFGTL